MKFLVQQRIKEFLEEDLGHGDITSRIVPEVFATGRIVSKNNGVIAGLEEVKLLFDELECETETFVEDGVKIDKNEPVLQVFGQARNILAGERVALNLLSRMSGIATLSRKINERAKKVNKNIKVVGTRKTCPGMRYFDKKAVRVGTGHSHRFALDDCMLIKDNHLAFFGVQRALNLAKHEDWVHRIEIEVKTKQEALLAAEHGADIIMLDSFKVSQVQRTVEELKKRELRKKVIIEASGGLNYNNIQSYAKVVDVVLVDALTTSAPPLEFTMELDTD